jgi:NifB/MoaA-like Fe-S oxidoreductase
MRLHSVAEARAMVHAISEWQQVFLRTLGRRMVFAADEYYLMAGLPFPEAEEYEGFHMHEDGIGMARTFEAEFLGGVTAPTGVQSGFFAWVDGAPAAGYRAPRNPAGDTGLRGNSSGTTVALQLTPRRTAPVGILTGVFGARILAPLVQALDRSDIRVIPVPNEFFGGNTSVTGLMVGADIARVLADEPAGHRYLLPDVCLSEGRFLDGTTVTDLPHPVEVVPTDGIALRRALGAPSLEPVA